MVNSQNKRIAELQRRVRDKKEPRSPKFIDKLIYNTVGEGIVSPVVLKHVRGKPNELVHGQQALSRQVPPFLRRKTHDWDVMTTASALRNADLIEDKLDKAMGSDMFYVRVVRVGYDTIVFRVTSRADGREIVDYIAEDNLPEHVVVDNVKFESLKVLRARALKILRTPSLKFKHHKARDDVRRIDQAMRMKKGIIPW